ncbi:unnamed protein product [Ectocarpus sp. 12 AP-2014]
MPVCDITDPDCRHIFNVFSTGTSTDSSYEVQHIYLGWESRPRDNTPCRDSTRKLAGEADIIWKPWDSTLILRSNQQRSLDGNMSKFTPYRSFCRALLPYADSNLKTACTVCGVTTLNIPGGLD